MHHTPAAVSQNFRTRRTRRVVGCVASCLFFAASTAPAQVPTDLGPLPKLQDTQSFETSTTDPVTEALAGYLQAGVECLDPTDIDYGKNAYIARGCTSDRGMDDARRTEVKTGDRYIRAGLLFAAQIWLMVEQVKGIVTSAKGIADSYEKIAEALRGQGARVGLLRIADATEEMAATLHATQYASMRLPTGNGQRYQVINQIVTSALARSRDAYSDAATMADEGSRMQMRLRPGRTSAYGGTVFSVNMGGYRPDIEEAPMANPADPADPENAKPFLAYHEAESEEGEGDLWEPDGGSGSTAMAAPSIGGVPRVPVASALPVPSGAPLLSPRDLKGLSQQDRATLLFAGATASPSAIALAAQVATGGVPARAAARAPLRTAEAILVAARGPARASFQERYQGNAAACPVPEDNASQDNGTILMARAAAQASAAVIAADVTVTDVQAQREKLRLAAAAEARAHRDLKLGNVRRSFGRF